MWLVKVPLYRKDYWERDYQCLNDTPRRTLHGKLTQWGKTLQEPPIYFLLLIRQLLFENLTQVFFKKLISVVLSLFCGHKKSNAVSIRLWPSFVLRALLKIIYSEKATKSIEIFTLLLTVCTVCTVCMYCSQK